MRKLLRANLFRLGRDKIFAAASLLMFLIGAALPVIHYLDKREYATGWTPDSTAFVFVFLVPVLLAVFSSLFIGSEYSDGTLRNKLIAGHRRCSCYLANLITCIIAGILLGISYSVPHTCLGIVLLGSFQTTPLQLLLYAGLSIALSMAFASLYTLLSIGCQSKAYAAAGCILLSFGLLFAGVHIVSALNEPEYYQAYSYTENGVTVSEEESRNPNYLYGAKRQMYEFLYDFTPGGQAIQLANAEAAHPLLLFVYDGMILLAATGSGLLMFRKRNLK